MDMNSWLLEWISCDPMAQAAVGEHEIENNDLGLWGRGSVYVRANHMFWSGNSDVVYGEDESSSQYGRSLILALSTK
jgi:hypothetical protein